VSISLSYKLRETHTHTHTHTQRLNILNLENPKSEMLEDLKILNNNMNSQVENSTPGLMTGHSQNAGALKLL
jgi:hypothetical protein